MTEKSPRGFDFHCHLDLYTDPAAMVASCVQDRIVTLTVTTTPKAWPQNRKWAAGNAYVLTAVGLHPEVVGDRHGEVGLLEEYMKDSRLVGEVGLDGSPQHRSSWDKQIEVFGRALLTAQRLGGRVVAARDFPVAGDRAALERSSEVAFLSRESRAFQLIQRSAPGKPGPSSVPTIFDGIHACGARLG
jgi:TatD DNase family protein